MKIQPRPVRSRGFHLAGVVPLSERSLDFNFPWPNHLTPLDGNLSMVKYAVYKCLYAGCQTIWIALNRKGYTLIREDIGEYAKGDQKMYNPAFGRYDRYVVPIFYWPRSSPGPRYYDFASRVSKVMEMSRRVSGRHSEHIIPDRYFVSFPGSVYNAGLLREPRSNKITPKYMLEGPDSETVKDGVKLDFICDFHDQNEFEGLLKKANAGFVGKRKAEQSSMGLEEVLAETEEEERLQVPQYFDIRSWNSYRNFLGSDFEIDLVEKELVSGDFIHRSITDE